MPEAFIDRIIREKLQHLSLSPAPGDWEALRAQLEAAFDAALRAQLAQATLPLVPEDWQAFAESLDAAFDEALRQRLSAHEAELNPVDWPLMAALLSPFSVDSIVAQGLTPHVEAPEPGDWEALAAQLDAHPLDTQVRAGLTQLERAAANPPDWDDMAQYMDDSFDASLRDRLEGYTLPYDAAAWPAMAAQLDQHPVDTLVREGLEGYALSPLMQDWLDMIHRLEAPFDALVREKLGHHFVAYRAADWRRMAARLAGPRESIPPRPVRRYLVAAAVVLLLLFTGGGIRQWVKQATPGTSPARMTALPSVVAPAPEDAIAPAVSASSAPSVAPLPSRLAAVRPLAPGGLAPATPALAVAAPLPIALGDTAVPAATTPPTRRAGPALKSLSQPGNARSLAFPLAQARGLDLLDPMAANPSPELRLSLYGGTAGTQAELNAPDRGPGYTTGLRLEMKLNDGWSVVTGLLYSRKRFSHRYPVLRNGLPEWGKLQGDLSLIEAPLLLRYHYPLSRKLSVYGQFGVVTTVSLAENYTDFNPNDPVNAQASRRADPEDLNPNQLSWSLNTYPGNVQVAAGLEYALGDRWALQVEPYFQQSLQRTKGSASLGFQKKLYTTGIATSLVFRLNGAE